jgi:hypothetical protein
MSKLQSNVDTLTEFITSIGLRSYVKKKKFIVFSTRWADWTTHSFRRTDRWWMELQLNKSRTRCSWIYTPTTDLHGRSISMRCWRNWDQWFSRSKDPDTYSTTSNSGHSTMHTLCLTSAILTRFGTCVAREMLPLPSICTEERSCLLIDLVSFKTCCKFFKYQKWTNKVQFCAHIIGGRRPPRHQKSKQVWFLCWHVQD